MDTHTEWEAVILSQPQVFLYDRWFLLKFAVLSGIFFNQRGMGTKAIFGDQVATKQEMGYIQVLVYIKSCLGGTWESAGPSSLQS